MRKLSSTVKGMCNALACGVMIAAAWDLIHDGQDYNGPMTVVGLLLGAAFVYYTQKRFSDDSEKFKFAELSGINARKAIMIVSIMTVHSVGEGAGVGVSFAGGNGWTKGLLVTIAIGVHNVPEGLAIAMVLVSRGTPTLNAMLWAIFTSLPQPLLAVPAFVFVDAFRSFLPFALGFAAGCMIYVVFAELVPDALEEIPSRVLAVATTVAAAFLELTRVILDSYNEPGALQLTDPDGKFEDTPLLIVYGAAVALASSVLGALLSALLTRRYAALNVIKILVMVFAGAFAVGASTRELGVCTRFYAPHVHLNELYIFVVVGGLLGWYLLRYLPTGERDQLSLNGDMHDGMGSPTKGKKTLNTSMKIPMYVTASLAVWVFTLGLGISPMGIRRTSASLVYNVGKPLVACTLATMAMASHRGVERGLLPYLGGIVVGSALLLGVLAGTYSYKLSESSMLLRSMGTGMNLLFLGVCIREIANKRAFGAQSLKYWVFIWSSVLAGLVAGVVLITSQQLVVFSGNPYLMTFC